MMVQYFNIHMAGYKYIAHAEYEARVH